jgi:WD40 repeat protein
MKRIVLVLCVLCVAGTMALAADDPAFGEPITVLRDGDEYDTIHSVILAVDAPSPKELHEALMGTLPGMMGFSPLWSPDGQWLAVASGDGAIFLLPAAGGNPVCIYADVYQPYEQYLITLSDSRICGFTPDGSEVLLSQKYVCDEATITVRYEVTETMYSSGIGWSGPLRVIAVNISTGAVRIVEEGIKSAAYSPSGRYLVTSTDRQSVVHDLVTGSEWNLKYSLNSGYTFTPDDRYILASHNQRLARIALDGSTFEILGTIKLYSTTVSVSPDGQWALVTLSDGPMSDTVYDENGKIISKFIVGDKKVMHAYNISNGTILRLFPGENYVESWGGSLSPDGDRFSYIMKDRTSRYGQTLLMKDFPDNSVLMKFTGVADETPAQFTIAGNYPNPFNPATTISFSLAEPGHAGLAVYNIAGQLVRELSDGVLPAGTHDIVWDGCDDTGMRVSSGVYFARLTNGMNSQAHRMTLLK